MEGAPDGAFWAPVANPAPVFRPGACRKGPLMFVGRNALTHASGSLVGAGKRLSHFLHPSTPWNWPMQTHIATLQRRFRDPLSLWRSFAPMCFAALCSRGACAWSTWCLDVHPGYAFWAAAMSVTCPRAARSLHCHRVGAMSCPGPSDEGRRRPQPSEQSRSTLWCRLAASTSHSPLVVHLCCCALEPPVWPCPRCCTPSCGENSGCFVLGGSWAVRGTLPAVAGA